MNLILCCAEIPLCGNDTIPIYISLVVHNGNQKLSPNYNIQICFANCYNIINSSHAWISIPYYSVSLPVSVSWPSSKLKLINLPEWSNSRCSPDGIAVFERRCSKIDHTCSILIRGIYVTCVLSDRRGSVVASSGWI